MNRLGEAPNLCRIFRILVSDRVNLSISSSRIKVCLQEGLEIGVGALDIKFKPACFKCLVCERTHVISWLYKEKRLETRKMTSNIFMRARENGTWTYVPSSSTWPPRMGTLA